MIGEYKVSRPSRQCFLEKRPLKEGEWYFSVLLIGEGDQCERRDYSAEAWEGPPEGAVGYWKCRMPVSGPKKMVLAPREVLIDLLRQMESVPEQAKTRYLLALLLLRRRYVRLADSPAAVLGAAPASGQSDDAGTEVDDIPMLHLEVIDDGSTIDVHQCQIARSETDALSEAITELLYCEASDTDQDD